MGEGLRPGGGKKLRSWKREDRVGKEPEARTELMTVGDEV